MTKDELIREISYCSSFHAFCHDGSTINIIAENSENSIEYPETFMTFSDDVEYLDDISVNWEALKTAKNRSLGNVYAILNLVNDYINTPVEHLATLSFLLPLFVALKSVAMAVMIEEASKAAQAKQPVYYMGDCYDIIYCKYSKAGDVALVQRRSLSNRYGPVEIEPRYLNLEANHV